MQAVNVYLVLVMNDEHTDRLLVKFLLIIWGQACLSFSLYCLMLIKLCTITG